MHVIAIHHGDLTGKFGVPRQAGLAEDLGSFVAFEPPYRDASALRGLEGFSHIWLLWLFSENGPARFSPTVRPPRLGGNRRLGVFATRSPNRPNPIGLSCVRLVAVGSHPSYGPVLRIAGADLADGTPIVDIKPYVPYADAIPDARAGFASERPPSLRVVLPPDCPLNPSQRAALVSVLSNDPRPAYHADPDRVYGIVFAHRNVLFSVADGVVTVHGIS